MMFFIITIKVSVATREGMGWLSAAVAETLNTIKENPQEYLEIHKKYPTIFEEMNGISDNNATSESDTDSSTSDSDISPTIVFNTYRDMISDCRTSDHFLKTGINFIHTMFPHELLANTFEELKINDSPINLFQTQLHNELKDSLTENENIMLAYLHFKTALITYNTVILTNSLDVPEVVEFAYNKIFINLIDKFDNA